MNPRHVLFVSLCGASFVRLTDTLRSHVQTELSEKLLPLRPSDLRPSDTRKVFPPLSLYLPFPKATRPFDRFWNSMAVLSLESRQRTEFVLRRFSPRSNSIIKSYNTGGRIVTCDVWPWSSAYPCFWSCGGGFGGVCRREGLDGNLCILGRIQFLVQPVRT